MRLIDADGFDRRLVNSEFSAALDEADDRDKPFEHIAMYYSTQSFRDVMKHIPTIEAIPKTWLEMMLNDAIEQRDMETANAIQCVMKLWYESKADSDDEGKLISIIP